jgi:hypothetical protein
VAANGAFFYPTLSKKANAEMPDFELRAQKSPDSWSGLKVKRRAGGESAKLPSYFVFK